MKRYLSLLVSAFILVSLFCGCAGQPAATQPTAAQSPAAVSQAPAASPSGAPQSAAPAGAAQTITIGVGAGDLINNMVAGFEKANPDIKVEVVTNETANREQVLKTGIAAGDPVDVGQYWGSRLNTFSSIGMCSDMQTYLGENNGEWKQHISTSCLSVNTDKNGEVWGIPVSAVYHVMFYNKDMMDKYGFQEPQTWDDLTNIFAALKKDDIFGFTTNSVSMQDCIYGLIFPLLEKIKPDDAWAAANGDVSFAGTPEADAIKEGIELVKSWYGKGYWYPGESGINTSQDDSNAGFAQGRCMFIFNYSGALGIHAKSCNFNIGIMMRPVKDASYKSYTDIETDVYFIPSNVPKENIDPSIKFLKYMTSQEGQQIVADTSTVPATDYDLNMSDGLKKLIGFQSTGLLKPGLNPCRMGSKMQTFIKQEVFSGPCGNTRSIDDTLKEMENIRQAIKSGSK